jgi:hypothetical protein
MGICFNKIDYYGSGKIILNPEKIANTIKATGIDPESLSKNLYRCHILHNIRDKFLLKS